MLVISQPSNHFLCVITSRGQPCGVEMSVIRTVIGRVCIFIAVCWETSVWE